MILQGTPSPNFGSARSDFLSAYDWGTIVRKLIRTVRMPPPSWGDREYLRTAEQMCLLQAERRPPLLRHRCSWSRGEAHVVRALTGKWTEFGLRTYSVMCLN